jgi:uncharacterized protein (TIGR03067 family)
MNVRYHRIAAVSILVTGVVVLLGWGRSMAVESGGIKLTRDQFQGKWVATLVESGATLKVEGDQAATCQAEFEGKNVVFHQLIGGIDARGTVYLAQPNKADFKLDAGWVVGVYEFDGDTLKLCVSRFSPLERLGVPSQPRAREVKPGEGHDYYVFRRASR